MGSSDIFSSSHGPGVIGTFMALVVLLGFGGLYMLVGDSYLSSGPPIETQIEELDKDIAILKSSIAAHSEEVESFAELKDAAFKLQRLAIKNKELENQIAELETNRESATTKLDAGMAEFEDYKTRYRESARLSLVDKVYEELQSQDGTTFRNVKVTSVDPVRISFQHKNGLGKIDLANLPEEMRDYLQFSSEEAQSKIVDEQTLDSNLAVDVAIAKQEDKVIRLEQRKAELTEQISTQKSLMKRNQRAIPMLETAIRTKRIDIANERSKRGVSKVPQMREELSQMEAKLRKIQKSIPEASRKIAELTKELNETVAAISEARAKLARLHAGQME